MRRLDVNLRDFLRHTMVLEGLVGALGSLEVRFQKVAVELIMLRLFALLEAQLQSVTVKILCGASYLDGTTALLLRASHGRPQAITNMRSFGRARTINLHWTTATAIRTNVIMLLDGTDPFYGVLTAHEAFIDEMRRVRNHVAHWNPDTRTKFRPVVQAYYGAYVNAVTPSVLLLSTRQTPPVIRQYIVGARVLVKDLVRG